MSCGYDIKDIEKRWEDIIARGCARHGIDLSAVEDLPLSAGHDPRRRRSSGIQDRRPNQTPEQIAESILERLKIHDVSVRSIWVGTRYLNSNSGSNYYIHVIGIYNPDATKYQSLFSTHSREIEIAKRILEIMASKIKEGKK